jgi:putative transposase
MRRSRFSEEQIIKARKGHAAGLSAVDLCRKYGISDASINRRFYRQHNRKKGILALARAAQRIEQSEHNKVQFRIAGAGKEAFVKTLQAQFPERLTEFVGWTRASSFSHPSTLLLCLRS